MHPAFSDHLITHNSLLIFLPLHPTIKFHLSDPTSEQRKQDHIELALKSQTGSLENDMRFYYEPVLSGHHTVSLEKEFLGKKLANPIWISSMTGGTEQAGVINRNLAKACNEFGMGMGLGSCRRLLNDDKYFDDFNLRPIIGKNLPFFANLGIAQIEHNLADNTVDAIKKMVQSLDADGLIVHINPFQEWLQPEGDNFTKSPLETLQQLLLEVDFPLIVKEVGQGMGPESVKALLQLPIAALDFGAYGGTNFAKLEMLRSNNAEGSVFNELAYIGHTAEEMVAFVNQAAATLGNDLKCREVIISGGVKNFLDGYYLTQKLNLNSIYAQGSGFLKYAQTGYAELKTYIESQRDGLILCNNFLKVK